MINGLQLLGKGSWVKALAAKDDDGNVEVVLSNFDPRGANNEAVPITFENIEPGNYVVTQEFLGGRQQRIQVATSAAVLQTSVLMGPNSVAFIELIKQ